MVLSIDSPIVVWSLIMVLVEVVDLAYCRGLVVVIELCVASYPSSSSSSVSIMGSSPISSGIKNGLAVISGSVIGVLIVVFRYLGY